MHATGPFSNPSEAHAIAELNDRSREIFRQIVESYLVTGEPVGSRHLSRLLPMTLSPASIRNVMAEERGRIEAQMRAAASGHTMETALTEASTLLSGVSRGAGVVVTSKSNARLKHIEFVRLDPARALVVLVSEDGSVENRLLDLPVGLPPSALVEAGNFLNARIRGRTLAEMKGEIEARRAEMERELDALTA